MQDKLQAAEFKQKIPIAFPDKPAIFSEQMKYSVEKTQTKGRKQIGREYDVLAERIKSLPDKKSVHFEVPRGQMINRVRTKLYNVLKSRGVDVSIVRLSSSELEISKAS